VSGVGVTATRHGLTDAQRRAARTWLAHAFTVYESRHFHHGDCVRGDEELAGIARALGYLLVAHPPTDERLRAFVESDRVLPALPYLDRNRAIVHSVGRLLACPDGPERLRSGTWSTIRFARAVHCPVTVLLPDGSMS
jgi:hypothetical protein